MAREIVERLLDDLDGRDGGQDGVVWPAMVRAYEIDLNSDNADKLRDAFAPYVERGPVAAGRQGWSRRATAARAAHSTPTEPTTFVTGRGSTATRSVTGVASPKEIVDAYDAAH